MNKLRLLLPSLLLIIPVFSISCVSRQYEVTEPYAETLYKTESHTEIVNETQKYIKPDWTNYAPVYPKKVEWAKNAAEVYFDGYRINASENITSKVKIMLNEHPLESKWAIEVLDFTNLEPIPDWPLSYVKQNGLIEGELKYRLEYPAQHWLDNLNAVTTDPSRRLCFVNCDEFYDEYIEVDLGSADHFVVMTFVPANSPEQQTTGVIVAAVSPPTVIKNVQLISYEEKVTEEEIPYRVTEERTVTKTEQVPFWEVIFNR
jgi:hypothetical protein